MSSIERSTMENSNILREIADFDITAPISISISFEDDLDEAPIKTEIERNDYQENYEATNTAFVPILEPKTEIEAGTITPCKLTEELSNKVTAHKDFQDTSALQPGSPQNQLSTSETLRKRKAVDVEMCKPKQFKSISDKNNCNEGISPHTFTSHTKEYNIQAGPTIKTCENAKKTTSIVSDLPRIGTDNQSERNYGSETPQQIVDDLNAYVNNCLISLSENMRRIMQAYGAFRRQQISKEDFMRIKWCQFKSSYITVVTLLVPEENNNELISRFLKDTLQCSSSIDSGSGFVQTYQDYANLLHEMITWTKIKQQRSQNEKSSQPTCLPNCVTTELQVNINPALDKKSDTIPVINSNTKGDNICIFSSGPPERELNISIDPRSNKYMQITSQSNAETVDGGMAQGKTAVECLQRVEANNNKPTHQSVIQPTTPHIPNLVSNYPQQNPMMSLNSLSYLMANYSIPSQQVRDPTPVLRTQLGKAPLQSHLTQSVATQRPPPRYGPSRNFAPQGQQPMPPPPYSRHLQTQSGPQQQMPPQYNQVPVLQTKTTSTQLQYLHASLGPLYSQSQPLQSQLGQSHLPELHNNQTTQPQVRLSQQGSQQQNPQTEHWPSLVELLSTESTPPLPYPNEHTSSGLFGQRQSRNQQPQVQPLPMYQTEWQQALNGTFQAGQVSQKSQKGSSRSASTDSGFISPLNFNVSTDQTMPAMPQEPESPMPTIVHVTSLSNKASYVELGKCVVCKRSTKQMCMGCMKMYYCTYECQSVDWAAHAPNCTKQDTN